MKLSRRQVLSAGAASVLAQASARAQADPAAGTQKPGRFSQVEKLSEWTGD